jgi:hypothetical protein
MIITTLAVLYVAFLSTTRTIKWVNQAMTKMNDFDFVSS